MKDQIQPHELCAYLPYKVEVKTPYGQSRVVSFCTETETVNIGQEEEFRLADVKLLLRPLSDLRKDVVCGRVVMDYNYVDLLRDYCICDNDHAWIDALEDDWASAEDKIMLGPYHLIQCLHEWHFDTFNLHNRGLCYNYNHV